MPDVRVPREAIERLKTWVVLPADQYEQATAEIVEAALPFLRAQWEAERAKLLELLRDVRTSGVAFEDSRLDYLEVQIDRQTWNEIEAALGA